MSELMKVHLSLLAKFIQSSLFKQVKEELKHELTEKDNKIEELKEELKQQKVINGVQKQQSTEHLQEVKQLCAIKKMYQSVLDTTTYLHSSRWIQKCLVVYYADSEILGANVLVAIHLI